MQVTFLHSYLQSLSVSPSLCGGCNTSHESRALRYFYLVAFLDLKKKEVYFTNKTQNYSLQN